jgi:hypothetical protein
MDPGPAPDHTLKLQIIKKLKISQTVDAPQMGSNFNTVLYILIRAFDAFPVLIPEILSDNTERCSNCFIIHDESF